MIAIDCVPVAGEVAIAFETGHAVYRAASTADTDRDYVEGSTGR